MQKTYLESNKFTIWGRGKFGEFLFLDAVTIKKEDFSNIFLKSSFFIFYKIAFPECKKLIYAESYFRFLKASILSSVLG